MEPLVYTPTYEIFLVVDSLRSSFSAVAPALAQLDSGEAPPLLGADVYYRERTDIALLALRFDERRVGLRELAWVQELASGAGVPLLDPQRLSEDDRRGFYQSYLAGYELRLEDFGTVRHALRELGRQLGLTDGRPETEAPRPMPELDSEPMVIESRDIVQAAPAADTERLVRPIPAPTRARAGSPPLGSPPPEALARGKARTRERPETVPATPRARAASPDQPVADGSGLLTLPPPDAMASTGIEVRYLRGDAWSPARLRALSARGAYLVAGGLPRRGEWVHLALAFRGVTAVIAGIVQQVTTIEDALSTGACGFQVKFPTDATPERAQLVELLQQARAAGVTLRPPPARFGVRFPVRWPVRLAGREGGFGGEALDVSLGGMFVHTGHAVGDEVAFRLPLDSDDTPLNGRARVARRVDVDMVLSRGLVGGYGLEIVELGDTDEGRWRGFLDRVRIRTERRVLVAAEEERARALRDGLAAAGYTAAAVSNLDGLMAQLAAQAPDVLVLDDLLLPVADRAGALARLGDLPRVAPGDDPPRRVRHLVDIALGIPLPS